MKSVLVARRIGGWTRIWLVISGISLVIGVSSAYSDYGYRLEQADKSFKEKSDYRKTCDELRGVPPADPFDKMMYGACPTYPGQSEIEAEHRSAAADAFGASVRVAFNIFFWPSAAIGLAFALLGWIFSGFRRRTQD